MCRSRHVLFVLAVLVGSACSGSSREVDRSESDNSLCTEGDIAVSANYGEPGSGDGVIVFGSRNPATLCGLSARTKIEFRDGRDIPIQAQLLAPAAQDYLVRVKGDPNGDPLLNFSAFLLFDWNNWCGARLQGPLRIAATLEYGVVLTAAATASQDPHGDITSPPCEDIRGESRIDLRPGLRGRVIANDAEPCDPKQLSVRPDSYHEKTWREGVVGGAVWITNETVVPCTLRDFSMVELTDGQGSPIRVKLEKRPSETDERVLVGPSDSYVDFRWSNWCGGPLIGPFSVGLTLANGLGSIEWVVIGSTDEGGNVRTPPCHDDSKDSVFEMESGF